MSETEHSLASPESESPSSCTVCRQEKAEPGYSTLLCVTCRDRLSRRPFPLAIKISAVVILVILVFAVKRCERSIRAGISYSRGQRAEQREDHKQAIHHYQEVVAIFPDSTPALIRLAKAYCDADQIDEAAAALNRLVGHVIPRESKSDYKRTFEKVKYELRLRAAGYNNVRPR